MYVSKLHNCKIRIVQKYSIKFKKLIKYEKKWLIYTVQTLEKNKYKHHLFFNKNRYEIAIVRLTLLCYHRGLSFTTQNCENRNIFFVILFLQYNITLIKPLMYENKLATGVCIESSQ